MNGLLARTIYGVLSAGMLAQGVAWVKFELIEELHPHDPEFAVIWICSGLALGWAAIRGVGAPGSITRAVVWTVGGLGISLFVLLAYGLSQVW